jgi:hypothetical protein
MASVTREYWLWNVAALACCFAPQGHFFGLETGTYGHHSVRAGALDAQLGAQNPQLVGFTSTRAALDPGLVRLGRLGAVMATRVQNVQNGQQIAPFRLPPLCGVELKPRTWQNVPPRGFSRTTHPRGP